MPSWTLINTESLLLYFPGNLLKQEHFFLELVVFETETFFLHYPQAAFEKRENIWRLKNRRLWKNWKHLYYHDRSLFDKDWNIWRLSNRRLCMHFDKDWNLCYLPGEFADMRTSAVQLHLDEQELRMKHFFGLPS